MDVASRLERAVELLEEERDVYPRSMPFAGWVWAGSAIAYLRDATQELDAATENVDSALARINTSSVGGQGLPRIAEAHEHIQAVRSDLARPG